MTWDSRANGYFWLYSDEMAAPLVAGYRYISSKLHGDTWHHAYREGREERK